LVEKRENHAGVIPLAINEGFRPEKIRIQPIKGREIIVEPISTKTDGKAPFLPSIFTLNEQQEHEVLSAEEFDEKLRQMDLTLRPLLIFDQFEEFITSFEIGFTKQMVEDAIANQKRLWDTIGGLISDDNSLLRC
jgi:hypothetical protein